MVFEDEEMWCVDDVAMAVALRGRARFTWKGSGQGWEETFFYRVALAVDVGAQQGNGGGGGGEGAGVSGKGDGRTDLGGVGVGVASSSSRSPSSPSSSPSAKKEKDVFGDGKLKVCEYRIWADTGAAYLARLGRLDELVVNGCVDGSGRGGYEGIHLPGQKEETKEKDGSGETRGSLSRKRSGGQDVLGAGLSVYGSSG